MSRIWHFVLPVDASQGKDVHSPFGGGTLQGSNDAAKEIGAWATIVKEVRWHNSSEVRSLFKDADNVKGYVIFNIRENRCRLITMIHYAKTDKTRRTQGHVYIRAFLTPKEYDNPANWDRRFGTK